MRSLLLCRVPINVCPLAGIRDHMVQSVELKFNCFLLMPVVDAFPSRLRAELEVHTHPRPGWL